MIEIKSKLHGPILVSFYSDHVWKNAAKRFGKQAHKSNFFQKIFIYQKRDLNFDLYNIPNDFPIKHPKGYGLWIWKPMILLDLMEKMPTNSIIVYADIGCEFNNSVQAASRFQEYLNLVKTYGNLAFELPHKENDWTSSYTLDGLASDQNRQSPQIAATVFMLKNDASNQNFIRSWLETMSKNQFTFLIGSQVFDESQNLSTHNHRYDQSVLSILWKKNRLFSISDETYHAPKWGRNGTSYPIWASRNKSRVTRGRYKVFRILDILILKFQNFVLTF